jgi:hypothetical protein
VRCFTLIAKLPGATNFGSDFMAITNRNLKDDLNLNQAAERQELISVLERTSAQTRLGSQLLALRLQMLKNGQRLATIDEINLALGRDRNENLY